MLITVTFTKVQVFDVCAICVTLQSEKPMVNFKGKYPEEFLKIHKTAPEMVDWAGGRITI